MSIVQKQGKIPFQQNPLGEESVPEREVIVLGATSHISLLNRVFHLKRGDTEYEYGL